METITGFHHVGMVADDPVALAEFYRGVLGMTGTGGSSRETARFGVNGLPRAAVPRRETTSSRYVANSMLHALRASRGPHSPMLRTLPRRVTSARSRWK